MAGCHRFNLRFCGLEAWKPTLLKRLSAYGRIVGRVYVDGFDVNRELVAQGFAWVYRKYSNDAELLRLEAEAKQKGLGLWADSNPIPPWEWRRGRSSFAWESVKPDATLGLKVL